MSVVDAISPEESDSVPAPYVGMRVAVRNNYLGTWSVGFEVVALHPDGYAMRRTSDGARAGPGDPVPRRPRAVGAGHRRHGLTATPHGTARSPMDRGPT